MFLIILILPLISAVVCGFYGKFIGFRGAAILSSTLIGSTFLASMCTFCRVGLLQNPKYINLGSWIQSGNLHVDWTFLFDSLTVTMLVVVTSISTAVHLYSTSYMSSDPHIARFMSYLSLFTMFMIILVTAGNFLQLFLGWEGVGICSYLLINFWYTRIQANKAAIKALVLNRVGDFSLMLAIVIIYHVFKSLDYHVVFALVPFYLNLNLFILGYTFNLINSICFLLMIGAIGKSAQIGLHTWLPDAMEGPTPVSALIHAATMVTAGIFLVIRCSPIFEYSPWVLSLIVVIGVLTSFFAATVGLVQNDIKKIIAYSTCSQLGYMFFVCGLSQYNVSLFHLSNHAFFKALLFLGAGSVIHSMGNEQDIRKMGGLVNFMPVTYITMLVASLSLAGFPFLSGFYSKDVILEISITAYGSVALFAYWLGVLTAFFTGFYSFRLIFLVFLTKTNAYKKVISHVHESPTIILALLVPLSMASIFIGFLSREFFIGSGSLSFLDAICILPEHIYCLDIEFLPLYYKNVPVIVSSLGILCSWLLFKCPIGDYVYSELWRSTIYMDILKFCNQKWYFDYIYNKLIGYPILKIGYTVFFKLLDKGIVEIIGPKGICWCVYQAFLNFRSGESGYIYQYACILGFFYIALFIFIQA